MDYDPHPLAERYPLMSGAEFEAFKADVAANGQQMTGMLFEGKLLDGRNRQRACRELGIRFEVAEFRGTAAEAAAYVESANLHRRHLDAEFRRKRVAELRSQGMSTRKIAAELGVHNRQVDRDIKAVANLPTVSAPAHRSEKEKATSESSMCSDRKAAGLGLPATEPAEGMPYVEGPHLQRPGHAHRSVPAVADGGSGLPPDVHCHVAERHTAVAGVAVGPPGGCPDSHDAEPVPVPLHPVGPPANQPQPQPAAEPARVTGRDGKQYPATRPKPAGDGRPPKRDTPEQDLFIARQLSTSLAAICQILDSPRWVERAPALPPEEKQSLIQSLEAAGADMLARAKRLRESL